jgi:hypothetical protein
MKQITVLMICALLALSACRDGAVQQGIWKPVLEDTDFSHLRTTGERLQVSLVTLRSNLAKGQVSEARRSLEGAEEKVRILMYYDIPITEVRQLIYDAGRLQALNRYDETLENLHRADQLLGDIGAHGNLSLQHALQVPRVMIEKLRETLEQQRQTTSTKYVAELSDAVTGQFSELGHKVNMMAIKGDLVLSGTDFNQTQQDTK